jgi:hypothetical protein
MIPVVSKLAFRLDRIACSNEFGRQVHLQIVVATVWRH